MKRIVTGILCISALSLILGACGAGEKKEAASSSAAPKATVLKLGHIANPGTAYDNYAHEFKRLVEEASGGRYQIDIYPSGQLGIDRELMESLQAGNVNFTVVTASDISNFVPEFEVIDLPYLYRDWDHVEKFLDSDAAKQLFALSDAVGMKTLSFMPRGFRHVTSSKGPINSPADLKGLKIRVAESSVYVDTFKALGANAQAMAWSEVYTALQQHTVDAHENTIITTRDYKINEVQKYLSETGHFFAFAALQTNLKQFNAMSAEDQAMIQKAALDAGKTLGLEQKRLEADAKAELESKGMIFNTLDKAPFEKLVQPVYDKYFQTHERTYFDLIKAL